METTKKRTPRTCSSDFKFSVFTLFGYEANNEENDVFCADGLHVEASHLTIDEAKAYMNDMLTKASAHTFLPNASYGAKSTAHMCIDDYSSSYPCFAPYVVFYCMEGIGHDASASVANIATANNLTEAQNNLIKQYLAK